MKKLLFSHNIYGLMEEREDYEDHKVGRLLRNITFSGKGFVEKPANPDSIIFDSNHIFDFSNASVI